MKEILFNRVSELSFISVVKVVFNNRLLLSWFVGAIDDFERKTAVEKLPHNDSCSIHAVNSGTVPWQTIIEFLSKRALMIWF